MHSRGQRPVRLRSGRVVALVSGLFVAGALEAAPREAAVRFVKPKHLATVIGPTTIKVHVNLPEGEKVERIELEIDGRLHASLAAPPWESTWDAGDGSRGHSLEAVAYLASGQQARSVIKTSALRVNQIESVDLVNLYLVVRDAQGRYVTDLTRDDFKILENRDPQSIERFSTTHKPLYVGIALDTSLSMKKGDRLEKAKKAAVSFLDILEAGDQALVVTFADSVQLAQEASSDKRALYPVIESASAGGGTALYDSIWRTSRELQGFDGRRVLVLLSDGRDEAANGFEPGSLHSLDEALEQALRSEAMIFPIGLGRGLDREYARRWGTLDGGSNVDSTQSLQAILERLADATGGRAVISPNAGKLRKAFSEIAADLRNQYSIAYVSNNPKHDGKWRKIQVLTPGRSLEVITRKGYYAPRPKRADFASGSRY